MFYIPTLQILLEILCFNLLILLAKNKARGENKAGTRG